MAVKILSSSSRIQKGDLLFTGVFEKDKGAAVWAKVEPEFASILKTAVKKGRFQGKPAQLFSSYNESFHYAPEITAIGLGGSKKFSVNCFRKAIGTMIQTAKKAKAKRVLIALETFVSKKVSLSDAAGCLAEISILAQYNFDRYKKKAEEDKKTKEVQFHLVLFKKSPGKDLEKKIDWHEKVAQGVLLARDLINEPGNIMNPPQLAKEARSLAAKKKLSCQVLGFNELKRLKMNGILAVNQGSVTPPAMIILEHGRSHKNRGTVCLVGKGVTFDTGGISIKPSRDMEKMKYDMSGAAAVIAAMGAIADLKLPLHVVGLAPAVENNVCQDPQRPGDIIKMHNGKTVEVLNTDAEGRLILADALAYCQKYKPKAIIDLATLTGMCLYTFSDKAIAVMGNDAKLLERVKKAGEETGERCWELPIWEEYAEQIKGHHSDLYNIGGPYGGTITAAMFLKEFVPQKTAWIHLDIAGTAWCNAPRYDCPKGATGVGVRLLAKMLSAWSGQR